MDPQQQEAFKQAVEDKKAQAAEAALAGDPNAGAVPQDHADAAPGAQDEPRDSASRHKQVTADKWNQ